MSKSYIALNLEGFEELLKKIEKAGGSINGAVDRAMRQSAQIQQNELKAQMHKANVKESLINRMPPPEIEWEGNRCTAKVGYKKGEYDPNNLSDGYKVVFINFGTPKRKPTQIKARGFINKAKKKARPQIKKAQKEALDDILGGLKK